MLPTIKQIREANGGLDNLTDFEIAQHQHQQYKAYVPDFNRFAQMVGVDAGTKWGNRLGASIDSAQASLAGVGESALDIEGLRGVRLKNSLDARNSRQFARSQGAIMESGQVDGVGSALEYVGGLAVDTAPQMLSTLGAGALGTLAAGPVGGAAAAGSVGYSFALGDILENQREQTGGRTDVGSASLLAVPYALADTFTGAGGTLLKLSKGTLPKAGLNLLDKTLDGVQGIKGAALRTGVNVGKASLAEGAGETFQEGMNQLGRMAVDPNETFLNDRSAEAFKESFIGGAALGGAIGGAAGGWRRSDSYQPPIDANGGVNLLNGQPLNPLVPQPAGPQLGYDPMAGDSRLITFPDGTTAFPEDVPERRAQLAAQDHPGFVERAAEYPEVPLVSLEQAALAEDKAKIEAAQAVQAEAKDLGIKGKGISLYQQLKQAWDDDIISEAEFREQRVQLGAKGNTDVARFLKGAYAASEARSVTQAAAAQEQAGLVESLKVQAAAQPEGVDPLEQDIQAALAAQAAPEADLAPAEQAWESARERLRTLPDAVRNSIPAMPVFGDLTPEQKTQVADLAAKDQFTLAAADTVLNPPANAKKVVERPTSDQESEFRRTIGQRLLSLRKFGATEEDKASLDILQDWMGVDVDANGELTPRPDTLSYSQIGKLLTNSKTGGVGVSRQAVHKTVAAMLSEIGAPKGTDAKKLRELLGFQLSGADYATVHRNSATTAELDGSASSSDDRASANMALDGAFGTLNSDETGADFKGPQAIEDDVGDGETEGYVEDLEDIVNRAREDATALEKVLDEDLTSGAILESDIAEAKFAFENMGTRKKWENLSTYDQAAAVRYYANARESGDPSVTENQREFNEAQKPGNTTAQPDTGAGTDARQGVRGAGGEPQGESRSAETGNGGNATAVQPLEEAQRPASPAPVVVIKKKRTIQKPVEAEVQAETAAEVVPTAPQILENLERLTSGTQPLVGEPTRTPSVSRQVRTLLSKLDSGEISAEAFASRLEMAVNAADRAKDNKPVTDRVRGADYFRQKLLEAKRRGDLPEEAVDLAEWFIQGNPALLDDVGISVRRSKNDGVSGFYDTMRRVVSLVKESGNAETTVHELLHHFERMMPAPVQDAIRKSWLNSLAKGIATAKKSGNADLVAYYQHLSDLHLGEGTQSSLLAAQQLLKDGKVPYEHYANINASEFWAVNGSAIVAGRFKASQSVLGRLRNWLSELGQKIKAAFGLQSDAPIIRALDSLAKSDGKFVSGSMLAKADSYNNVTQSVAQQLGPQYAKAETALTRAIGDLKTAAVKYGAFTRDLIDQAAKLMPAARKYLEHYEAVATDRTRMEQRVDAVLERFATLNTHERTRVNEVIRTSTMSKEWAFKPDWLKNAKYDENSDVARAFRALTPAQRGVIQDVFRHGHETLEAMQKAVKDNVNSEFDVLIKGFKDAGNMDEATKAEARKAKALTEFSSMLEMNGNWPYAPLRRFGDHVVVAKSAAYRAAELADDKAQIKALEADENHYYVEFFESRGEARKKVADMQATGKYAGGEVENFNKGNANEQLYGGRDMFNAFRRLRGLVNETGGASLSEPADVTINKLMNDLYLSLLGERSARQAERNRKNTAGADRDMMRAFATKGRADAHFIASLRFGGQVQEDLLKMKKEADEGPNGGTRELRREYFNEILARHTMQMDFQSTPVVDKVMATSSFWQLLFNPAYYLQNVMQPWVMSLPMLAGKHGYGKSWSALARAYRDLGPLIKDGAFTKGDYDALPADVRAIVKDLAARGRIEITLEHDLGQWNSNVDDKAHNRAFTWVTKGLRSVNSRLEMLNRLATGIAAARLEGVGNAKNATDYADRVIIGTHGDYNAFNAPRLMRTPLGRMATQFRKFQLIQITMYTKLISDALKGASPDGRAVARRVLAYNLGHMAVLGGAMGLPGFQLFSMVLGSIFGDDDEPDDAEATLRRIMGNGPVTDALTRGVPNAFGVDLSGKVGSGNMLSLFPYADWDIESRSGYQNLLAAAAGPFVGGLMPKWADAVGTAKQGDYYKALEKVLPGLLGNALKGTRFAVDGVTTTRGVQAMSADEITWVDGTFQAFGLPTGTITDRNFRSSAEYKASKFFDEKSSQVKKDYVEAFQDNDTDAMAEARQEWLDMQATRRRLGLTVQPLSQLIKAPRERMKRDRMAVGGVAADKETQGFVKNLME